MATDSKSITEVPAAANVAGTDKFLVLRNPEGAPSLRLVNSSVVSANLIISNSVPANSSANGIAGTIRSDSDFLYICVANNTWKRTALTTW